MCSVRVNVGGYGEVEPDLGLSWLGWGCRLARSHILCGSHPSLGHIPPPVMSSMAILAPRISSSEFQWQLFLHCLFDDHVQLFFHYVELFTFNDIMKVLPTKENHCWHFCIPNNLSITLITLFIFIPHLSTWFFFNKLRMCYTYFSWLTSYQEHARKQVSGSEMIMAVAILDYFITCK